MDWLSLFRMETKRNLHIFQILFLLSRSSGRDKFMICKCSAWNAKTQFRIFISICSLMIYLCVDLTGKREGKHPISEREILYVGVFATMNVRNIPFSFIKMLFNKSLFVVDWCFSIINLCVDLAGAREGRPTSSQR